MKYAHLTADQQAQVIQQRLLELESQHYQLELNKQQRRRLLADIADEEERSLLERAVAEITVAQDALDLKYAADAAALEELKPKKLNAKEKARA